MTKDFEHLYQYITFGQQEFGKLYDYTNTDIPLPKMIKELLDCAELDPDGENILAVLNRLVGLREDSLVQALEANKKTPKEIAKIKHKMYESVKSIYLDRHLALLDYIDEHQLLTPFYRLLLRGVHEVGKALSEWQPKWSEHILEIINPSLEKKYKTTESIMKALREEKLLEYEASGEESDRSYSALVLKENGYKPLTYALVFPDEVDAVLSAFNQLICSLETLEDLKYNHKEQWLDYFRALKFAFSEKDPSKVMEKWRRVDAKWMKITTPLQVGHPLEYYEDHYRKAVALEWDVRLNNPKANDENSIKESIKSMFTLVYKELELENNSMQSAVMTNLSKAQLYIGRPMLFYAAEFNGLFSAQVVPNDEIVSASDGKKIFAFADNVLDSIRAKPFLKIHTKVFGFDFMEKERELIFKKPELWHQVYAITTIGHEFGHILWMDKTSESRMNISGMFKNIEEFKATLGGLVAFFEQDEKKELAIYVLTDTIKRAVGLISWMKTGEVEAYYCEGLMHLHGLFESEVLVFEKDSLSINLKQYENAKKWYKKIYTELALHYAKTKDAKEFLGRFVSKEEDGFFLPKDEKVRKFVNYYWELYQKMGRSVEDVDVKAKWLEN
ncbi:MAG: invasion protein CiaB [Campylobacteraceae bacterium]|nr:invasion protein CiaB [Campylobacteraceae bacterium]